VSDRWKVAVGLAVLLLAAWAWSTALSRLDEQDRKLDKQTALALQMSQTYLIDLKIARAAREQADRVRDSLETVLERREIDASRLERVNSTLRSTLASATSVRDSLGIALKGWSVADSGWQAQKLVSATLQASRDSWHTEADRGWQQADSLSTIVIPGLTKALKDERDARQCKWLVVRCPSRGTMALVGVLVGGTLVAVANH
jgi:hypothetical protein